MMRRWLFPLVAGALVAGGAYQATLLATPYVLMNAAMKKIGARGPENRFAFGDMATADNQPIVRPSPDLSYSTCVFNLAKGPVLIDIEPVPDHYWSVSIFDARTDVAAVRSDRDTGGKAARLALVKAGQKAPAGYEPVRLEHDRGIALIRILLADPAEFPVIDAIRRKSTCKVL
ncbi:DUF1254 domain-containing protein [Sphingorhabdus lacus]|uniref:DUF1254 domain-containing protein n=1 Tax=Sphingorhabdus lacus TaxID=392610 RepID=A0A6I6L4L3_9SPHN|nr:DUF1254 domain-containing protein [Sphingorhabdus lacus]QGY80599.1 DUF1254 domain-containing protein [Sphingorhabdus lacus]